MLRPAALLPAIAATALAAVVAGAVAIRAFDARPFGALGIAWTKATVREIVAGIAIGSVAIAAAAALMLGSGRLSWVSEAGTAGAWAGSVAADFALFAVAAFAEEALFRGYGFQVFVRAAGPVAATLVSSVLFAAAHANNPEVGGFALANIFLAGVLLAAAYLRTRSLWFATAVHLGWNWAMASLFDLPVSGLAQFDTPLYEPVVGDPAWFTGGAFGPEGGLVGTVGLLLALAVVARVPGLDETEEMRALGPLVDERMRG